MENKISKPSKSIENSSNNPTPEDSIAKVFQNELLRDLILDPHIYGKEVCYMTKNIRNMRLVSKSWLDTTTKVHYKEREPIFLLSLDEVDASKTLEKFQEQIWDYEKTSKLYGNHPPPFMLWLEEYFFTFENWPVLTKCFTKFGNGLVRLHVDIPASEDANMPMSFPKFSLPLVKSARFRACAVFDEDEEELREERLEGGEDYRTEVILAESHSIYLMQAVLNATMALTEFSLDTDNSENFHGFRFLWFPNTLTKLDLNCSLTSTELETLLQQDFQPIELSLEVGRMNAPSFKNSDVLTRILKKFSKTLQSVLISKARLHPDHDFYNGKAFLDLSFVLERMKSFTISSCFVTVKEGSVNLDQCLPAVKNLGFYAESQDLVNWTQHSVFENVEFLILYLTNENSSEDDDRFALPFTAQMAGNVVLAFPNLTTLRLIVGGANLAGLSLVFEEMKQLKELAIMVKPGSKIKTSDPFDSILTGLPIKTVAGLRENTSSLENDEDETTSGTSSIKNLINLERLKLSHLISSSSEADVEPVISDISFRFALNQMSKLNSLILGGRFAKLPGWPEKYRWKN